MPYQLTDSTVFFEIMGVSAVSYPVQERHKPNLNKGARHSIRLSKFDAPGFHAYCSSQSCCRVETGLNARGLKTYKRRERVLKDVARGIRECPDCFSALVWRDA